MTCEIGSPREESSLAVSIAELALKSLGTVLVVFVPLQVGSAGALVRTHVTRKRLLTHMNVCDVLVADTGSCKTLVAGRAFVRAIPTVAPCVTLDTAGKSVWRRGQGTDTTSHPATEDFALDPMRGLEMLVHILT